MSMMKSNDRGSALIITMAIMLMLGIMGTVAFQSADTEKKMSFNQADLDEARLVAEAGLQLSVEQLQTDYFWRTGYTNKSFGDGTFSVTLVDETATPALQDSVIVRSTGIVDKAQSTIEAWVKRGYPPSFKYAVYAKDGIGMENHACTDSYNSDSTYAASVLPDGGNIGTGGNITMQNNTSVGGDASTTGGSITLQNSADVLGSTSTSAPPENLTFIPDAEYAYVSTHNDNATGLSGVYTYNAATKALSVGANKTLTLADGTYYFSSITTANQAKILLAPGAKVTVYLTGTMMMEQNTEFNATGKPSNLMIYSKGANLFIKNNSKFSGGFYGPATTFMFENNADVRGALVLKQATIKNNTCIHFDRKFLEELNFGETRIVASREL
jgi:Tfp pilus assembly protein PilX